MVGRPESTVLDWDEAAVLALRAQATAEVFTQLLRSVLYHAKAFRLEGKCDNTMCSYNNRGQLCLGQILFFAFSPQP